MSRRDYLSSYVMGERGCWIFTGSVNAKGYGRILRTTAHRYFYAALVGSVPASLQVDHLCGVKRCVNPDHLELVTNAENQRRKRLIDACGKCGRHLSGAPVRLRGMPLFFCADCMAPESRDSAEWPARLLSLFGVAA